MDTTMVFDIETIPDAELGRSIFQFSDPDDKKIRQAMLLQRLEQTKGESSFLMHHFHKIIAISVVVSKQNMVKVWSLGDENASEKELIERFFEGIERYTPCLVSWNGSGFDCPVLHYRALLHGVAATRYWENGDQDSNFKWNNYLSRYHQRHTDLMDVLANYQSRANAPLNEIALMLGLPGKMGMAGCAVLEHYEAGKLNDIRNYCETDVLNTYIIYLRFLLMKGKINKVELQLKTEALQNYLFNSEKPHLQAFLNEWTKTQQFITA